MEKEKQYYDYAIGIGTNNAQRRLLVAASGTYVNVNDTVETLRDTYCILFVDSFCTEDDRAVEAVKVAMNQQEPERIVRRIISERVDWEVESDDVDG
jgi:hypothetical protein